VNALVPSLHMSIADATRKALFGPHVAFHDKKDSLTETPFSPKAPFNSPATGLNIDGTKPSQYPPTPTPIRSSTPMPYPPHRSIPTKYQYPAEAKHSYEAELDCPDEVSFSKGGILQCLDFSGLWWKARMGSENGNCTVKLFDIVIVRSITGLIVGAG